MLFIESGQDELSLPGHDRHPRGALRVDGEDPVRLLVLLRDLPPRILHRRDGHVHELLGEDRTVCVPRRRRKQGSIAPCVSPWDIVSRVVTTRECWGGHDEEQRSRVGGESISRDAVEAPPYVV